MFSGWRCTGEKDGEVVRTHTGSRTGLQIINQDDDTELVPSVLAVTLTESVLYPIIHLLVIFASCTFCGNPRRYSLSKWEPHGVGELRTSPRLSMGTLEFDSVCPGGCTASCVFA